MFKKTIRKIREKIGINKYIHIHPSFFGTPIQPGMQMHIPITVYYDDHGIFIRNNDKKQYFYLCIREKPKDAS